MLHESFTIFYEYLPYNESTLPTFDYFLDYEEVFFYFLLICNFCGNKLVSTYYFEVTPIITIINWNSLIDSQIIQGKRLYLFEMLGDF